ncbi:MAG: GNAT family acetyltransferase [Thermoplasmata archaeon]|nr:MAG: GNAT family acetyltransferase [Thermoplasmata archaeon]
MNTVVELYNDSKHREQVIELWNSVFSSKDARNRPELSIDNKVSVKDDLFFIARDDNKVIGTIMAGYDGHRGWIYSMAVIPERRKLNVGTTLLKHAENELKKLGCVKINLQIFKDNESVIDFYLKNGYSVEERISMGKEIKDNIQRKNPCFSNWGT